MAEKLLEDTANFILSKGFKAGEKIQVSGYASDVIIDLIMREKKTEKKIIAFTVLLFSALMEKKALRDGLEVSAEKLLTSRRFLF